MHFLLLSGLVCSIVLCNSRVHPAVTVIGNCGIRGAGYAFVKSVDGVVCDINLNSRIDKQAVDCLNKVENPSTNPNGHISDRFVYFHKFDTSFVLHENGEPVCFEEEAPDAAFLIPIKINEKGHIAKARNGNIFVTYQGDVSPNGEPYSVPSEDASTYYEYFIFPMQKTIRKYAGCVSDLRSWERGDDFAADAIADLLDMTELVGYILSPDQFLPYDRRFGGYALEQSYYSKFAGDGPEDISDMIELVKNGDSITAKALPFDVLAKFDSAELTSSLQYCAYLPRYDVFLTLGTSKTLGIRHYSVQDGRVSYLTYCSRTRYSEGLPTRYADECFNDMIKVGKHQEYIQYRVRADGCPLSTSGNRIDWFGHSLRISSHDVRMPSKYSALFRGSPVTLLVDPGSSRVYYCQGGDMPKVVDRDSFIGFILDGNSFMPSNGALKSFRWEYWKFHFDISAAIVSKIKLVTARISPGYAAPITAIMGGLLFVFLPYMYSVFVGFLSAPYRSDVLVLFDIDGTLTPPRKEIDARMEAMLVALKGRVAIGFVGGSDLVKGQEQMHGKGSRPLM